MFNNLIATDRPARAVVRQSVPKGHSNQAWGMGEGGGGVLSLEKGTNCGPTAAERWLSQCAMRDG